MTVLMSSYDVKAESHEFFFARSTADAIRTFETHANNPETKIGRYPQDFVLFHHGTLAERGGELSEYHTEPVSLGLAQHLVHHTPVLENGSDPDGLQAPE